METTYHVELVSDGVNILSDIDNSLYKKVPLDISAEAKND